MSTEKKSPALKLAKLPNRKPVRITISLSVEFTARLATYAAMYRERYGEAEEVATLIPFMLATFIDGDREFAKLIRLSRLKSG